MLVLGVQQSDSVIHTHASILFHIENRHRQMASLVAQTVKRLPAIWETWVRFLGWEGPLEEGMVTCSSVLTWRMPRTEEPCGSIGSQRVEHD